MATYGAKSPLFAQIKSESINSFPTYATGFAVAKLVSCGVTPNAAEGSLYADNVLAEYAREQTDIDIALETDDLTVDKAAKLYGATLKDGELTYSQGDTSPLGGFSFYNTAQRNGAKVHIGHYYPKVRATRGAKTFQTKGNSITFGTSAISMKALFAENGAIEIESPAFDNENDAFAWCASKLGIAEYFSVDVQSQGGSGDEGVDKNGLTFVPAGESFTVSITGYENVVAAYDDGSDITSSITGGTGSYTIQNVNENHRIVIVF